MTLAAGETLQVSANGGTTWVDTTGSGTTWATADDAVALVSGNGTITARITDAAGNTAPVSLTNNNYTLDTGISTTIPSGTNTVAIVTDTGTDTTDRITSDPQVKVTLTLANSLTLAAGETLQVSANGGTTWVNTTGSGTTWATADDAVALVSGSGTITARITDAAGNTAPVSLTNNNYTLDTGISTTIPSGTNTVAIVTDTGTDTTDRITSDPQVKVTLTLANSLTLAAGETLQVSANGGTTWVNTTGSGTTWATADDAVALVSGSGTITARITDAAGNTAPVSLTNNNYTLDTAAPTVVITDNVANVATGDVTFTYTFNEAVTGFDANDINVTGGTKGAFNTVSSSVYTLVVTPTANTTGSITLSTSTTGVTDSAGNQAVAPGDYNQTFDTTPPSVLTLSNGWKLIAPYTVPVSGVEKTFYFLDYNANGVADTNDQLFGSALAPYFGTALGGTNTSLLTGKTLKIATAGDGSYNYTGSTYTYFSDSYTGPIDLPTIWASRISPGGGMPDGWLGYAYYGGGTNPNGGMHAFLAQNTTTATTTQSVTTYPNDYFKLYFAVHVI